MKLSSEGKKALIQREGSRRKAYKDTKGIWTIGVGHTGPEVFEGLAWSDAQIEWAFDVDVEWAEEAAGAVEAPLTQNQFDALVSFIFNVGAYAFKTSTMKRLLDKGEYEAAGKEFDKWHKPKEIIGRRNSERKQSLS